MKEVMGGWRRLHNEELHNLHASPHINKELKPRNMRWMGHVACMGEMRNAFKILVGKPEGTRPCGRSKHRCEHNIRLDLREIEWENVDWIHLPQDTDQ